MVTRSHPVSGGVVIWILVTLENESHANINSQRVNVCVNVLAVVLNVFDGIGLNNLAIQQHD